MRLHPISLTLLLSLAALTARAFPPAPYFQIHGTVRDDRGNPLGSETGTVILSGIYAALGCLGIPSYLSDFYQRLCSINRGTHWRSNPSSMLRIQPQFGYSTFTIRVPRPLSR